MTIIDESRAHADLRDRLDHLRAVADARQRVHAYLAAVERHNDVGLTAVGPVGGDRTEGEAVIYLGDLRVLLDADFTPTADRKWRDDDDEDETGLHRRQAMVQLGREENPEFPDESPDDRDWCR